MKPTARRLQRGVSVIHWLIALVPLLGIGAFAIDLNNVVLSTAELKNAADAGSLEGARTLYCNGGLTINHSGCFDQNGNQTAPPALDGATAAAQANASQQTAPGNPTAAEVTTVAFGHWEFQTNHLDANGIERGGVFTASANPTPDPLPLIDPATGQFRTFQDLNTNPNEINAVGITTARQATPIQSFLGRVLGIDSYQASNRSVAYVGFAGKILPGEVDQPIALCVEHVQDGCNVGRMINDNTDTGGWTNLQQPGQGAGSCSGAASANEVKGLVSCGGVSPSPELILGWDMQTSNGQVQSAFKPIFDCWDDGSLDTDGDGLADETLHWKLPVIDCETKPGGRCNTLLGAVDVEVLWIVNKANKIDQDAPKSMTRSDGTTWSSADPDGQARWDSFAAAFNIQQPDPNNPGQTQPAEWRQKSIYFNPSCTPAQIGGTGGTNFGVRAEIPVLVF